MLLDGEPLAMTDGAAQQWLLSWEHADSVPDGTRHGAAAICQVKGNIVLISQDEGSTWSFPGGRPEGDEDWHTTLVREVSEEAWLQDDGDREDLSWWVRLCERPAGV